MPAIPIQGGGFQDCLGNPIANGRLVMALNQEALDKLSQSILICSSEEVVYALDSMGNIITTSTPLVWTNTGLTPNTTYYMARVYNKSGVLTWGPNAVYAIGASVVDVSQWTSGNPV